MSEAARFFDDAREGLRLVGDALPQSPLRDELTERRLSGASRSVGGRVSSPFDTVLEGLCGCSEITFARVARQNSLDFSSIDFRSSFAFDPSRARATQTGAAAFNRVIVEAQVWTDAPVALFDKVVALTEAIYPIETLLNGSGIALQFLWRRVSNVH